MLDVCPRQGGYEARLGRRVVRALGFAIVRVRFWLARHRERDLSLSVHVAWGFRRPAFVFLALLSEHAADLSCSSSSAAASHLLQHLSMPRNACSGFFGGGGMTPSELVSLHHLSSPLDSAKLLLSWYKTMHSSSYTSKPSSTCSFSAGSCSVLNALEASCRSWQLASLYGVQTPRSFAQHWTSRSVAVTVASPPSSSPTRRTDERKDISSALSSSLRLPSVSSTKNDEEGSESKERVQTVGLSHCQREPHRHAGRGGGGEEEGGFSRHSPSLGELKEDQPQGRERSVQESSLSSTRGGENAMLPKGLLTSKTPRKDGREEEEEEGQEKKEKEERDFSSVTGLSEDEKQLPEEREEGAGGGESGQRAGRSAVVVSSGYTEKKKKNQQKKSYPHVTTSSSRSSRKASKEAETEQKASSSSFSSSCFPFSRQGDSFLPMMISGEDLLFAVKQRARLQLEMRALHLQRDFSLQKKEEWTDSVPSPPQTEPSSSRSRERDSSTPIRFFFLTNPQLLCLSSSSAPPPCSADTPGSRGACTSLEALAAHWPCLIGVDLFLPLLVASSHLLRCAKTLRRAAGTSETTERGDAEPREEEEEEKKKWRKKGCEGEETLSPPPPPPLMSRASSPSPSSSSSSSRGYASLLTIDSCLEILIEMRKLAWETWKVILVDCRTLEEVEENQYVRVAQSLLMDGKILLRQHPPQLPRCRRAEEGAEEKRGSEKLQPQEDLLLPGSCHSSASEGLAQQRAEKAKDEVREEGGKETCEGLSTKDSGQDSRDGGGAVSRERKDEDLGAGQKVADLVEDVGRFDTEEKRKEDEGAEEEERHLRIDASGDESTEKEGRCMHLKEDRGAGGGGGGAGDRHVVRREEFFIGEEGEEEERESSSLASRQDNHGGLSLLSMRNGKTSLAGEGDGFAKADDKVKGKEKEEDEEKKDTKKDEEGSEKRGRRSPTEDSEGERARVENRFVIDTSAFSFFNKKIRNSCATLSSSSPWSRTERKSSNQEKEEEDDDADLRRLLLKCEVARGRPIAIVGGTRTQGKGAEEEEEQESDDDDAASILARLLLQEHFARVSVLHGGWAGPSRFMHRPTQQAVARSSSCTLIPVLYEKQREKNKPQSLRTKSCIHVSISTCRYVRSRVYRLLISMYFYISVYTCICWHACVHAYVVWMCGHRL